MNHPTKQAKNLKKGDRIILGKGDNAPIGTVSFVYKSWKKVHVLIYVSDNENGFHTFSSSDLVPLAS